MTQGEENLSAEDHVLLAELRRRTREVLLTIAEDATAIAEDLANDDLLEELIVEDPDIDDELPAGCDHEWEIVTDGSPDFTIDVCLHCYAERATDLHTGKSTFIAP